MQSGDRSPDLSRLPDVHIPQTNVVESASELREWADRYGLPAVLKLDGTWGGQGVVLIRAKSEIGRAFLVANVRRSALRSIKRIVHDGDVEFLFSHPPRAAISVQAYVSGRLANAAVACWKGEVVGHVAVEVVRSRPSFGTASIVRIVDGEEMIAAARSIARHYELSGIYGFDFVLEDKSNSAQLTEINPRATQIDHLTGSRGHDWRRRCRRLCSAKRPTGSGLFPLRSKARSLCFLRNGCGIDEAPI